MTLASRVDLEIASLEMQLQEARAEVDHAKADQVRMARDGATMFDELRAIADRLLSCTPTGRGSRRSWNRRGGHDSGGW